MESNLIAFYIIFGILGLFVTHFSSYYTKSKYIIYLVLYIIATVINYMISTEKKDGERQLINTSISDRLLLTFYIFLYIIFLVFSGLISGLISEQIFLR